MIISVQLELLLCGLNGLPSVKKWIYRRQKRKATQVGIIPSISLMVDADVHSTLTGLHFCCRSPQRKQMGCQFPTGNATILGKQVLGGQGCKTARQAPPLPACGPYCWREMLLFLSSVINIILSPEAAKAHLVGG